MADQTDVTPQISDTLKPTKKKSLPPNCRKLPGQLSKKTIQAYELMDKTGIDSKQALILATNGKTPTISQTKWLDKNYARYRLSHPMMDKLARNAVKSVLKDGEVNGEKASVSAVLAAAAMVKDRTEPIIKQNLNVNLNADVSPVDLQKYLNNGRLDNEPK